MQKVMGSSWIPTQKPLKEWLTGFYGMKKKMEKNIARAEGWSETKPRIQKKSAHASGIKTKLKMTDIAFAGSIQKHRIAMVII